MTRLRDIAFASAFVALLFAPAVCAITSPESALLPGMAQEPLPTKFWKRSFPAKFEAFFDTHLGLRRHLVAAQRILDFFLFETAPASAALAGREGWAFLNQDFMPESIRGGVFPASELETWTNVFKQTQSFISAWGGKLLVVVAPNKATIYPEYLPEPARSARQEPRLDQFFSRLKANGIDALDLRPSLLAAKTHGLIYAKRDTHWVGRGVVVASLEIANSVSALAEKRSPLTEAEIEFESKAYTGDLATMLALEGWGHENIEYPLVKGHKVTKLHLAPGEVSAGQFVFAEGAIVYQSEAKVGPSVVIHHDSFGQPLQMVLPHAFSKSTWLFWTGSINHTVLAREKPDVVVYLTAERYLHRAPPKAPYGVQ